MLGHGEFERRQLLQKPGVNQVAWREGHSIFQLTRCLYALNKQNGYARSHHFQEIP